MEFFERIKQARTDANLTQTDVSEYFSKLGFSVKPYAISSWETGKHKPDLEQFAVLCKAYHADVMYLLTGKKGHTHESLLYGLNEKGRSHAINYLNLLKSDPVFTKEDHAGEAKKIRLYDIPVSAGTGMYLDSDNYEIITGEHLIPDGTSYAVRVSGDSMEPSFHDGQILFIREQKTLDDGEIGIFGLNGEAYVKKLSRGALVSLNAKYEPIRLLESDDVCVFGKVIGTN
ncbi:MAG: hypothetical protein BGN88_06575 [Clostridiales bacterium 43-6]|nr:MAG: hypothetical protein BGN88_06575 [Clostridiales bacterium 43-6]